MYTQVVDEAGAATKLEVLKVKDQTLDHHMEGIIQCNTRYRTILGE